MTVDMTLFGLLLIGLLLSALWTVMTTRLIRSAIGLALTSAVLAAIMFKAGAVWAAVIELSVCAGLIPAIFISTIGLTARLTPETLPARRQERMRRFWFLPILVILVGVALTQLPVPERLVTAAGVGDPDVRTVLWHTRHLDLLGQIVVLLGGAFAVVVLLKELRQTAAAPPPPPADNAEVKRGH